MAQAKLFIVVKQDTIVQMREYLVRADNPLHAEQCVNGGFFVSETEPETMELLESKTTTVEEIRMDIYDDQLGSVPKIARGQR